MKNKTHGNQENHMVTKETIDKKYPEDYTKEQQELIKAIVIERIKQMPENLRLSIG